MDFRGAISSRVAPLLRELGFKGSGRNFRRVRDDFCDLVSIGEGQRTRQGLFCVDLGCHPRLSLEPNVDPIPKSDLDFWFSKRLAPKGKEDQWWPIDPVSALHLDEVEDLLRTRAVEWFSRFDTFAGAFGDVTPESIENSTGFGTDFGITQSRFAFVAAKALFALGRPEQALAVAHCAQSLAGERAKILRDWINEFIQEIEMNHRTLS